MAIRLLNWRTSSAPQFAVLVFLFLFVVCFEAHFLLDLYHDFTFSYSAPPIQVGAPWPAITNVDSDAAKKAGVRVGDRVVSVDGRALRGRSDLMRPIRLKRPGQSVEIVVDRAGAPQNFVVRLSSVRTRRINSLVYTFAAVMFCLLPVLSILLGFTVAAIRPRDPMAWLLLAMLLSSTLLVNGNVSPLGWPGWLRIPTHAYIGFGETWPACILLFAIYFTQRFRFDTEFSWAKWLLLIPLGFLNVLASATSLGTSEAYRSLGFLEKVYAQLRPAKDVVWALTLCVALLTIAWKSRDGAIAKDGRRRLRLLLFGAIVSLTPLAILLIYIQFDRYRDNLWSALAIMLTFLLPVTMAHVIVVERAMDLRVAIRQGLQYTLARRGVLILQILVSTILFIVLAMLMTSHALSPIGTVLVLAAGLWVTFLLHGAAQRVAVWVDRRFFRDAYHAEQILSELAEKVRTIVETQPLLETVTQRIADSLHVRQIAVLLDGNGLYRPAHALGYGTLPELAFPQNAATVQLLKGEKQPTRVYFDDSDSWIYRTPEMSNEERTQLQTLHSELLLPFVVKDDLLGFISLGQKLSEAPYSRTDLHLLSSVAAQTGLALQVARLTSAISHEVASRERLNRELEIAREVQEHLFPQHFPSISGLDYFGFCQPAREVGGDYYDFLELPGGKLGIAIGDVSGKGIGASLMMAGLGASLRGQAAVLGDLTALIQRVNNLVYGASSVNRYATFFYAEYEPAKRLLSYVNAGHNPPCILRKSNPDFQLLRLEVGGPPVGLLPHSCYLQDSVALTPGDLLVLFTDGISESMNSQEEEWGEERLIDLAKDCDGLSARDVTTRIVAAAQTFAAEAPQHDDMTVVVVRVTC